MLRGVVLVVGIIALLIGAALCALQGCASPAAQFLLLGVLLAGGVWVERWRYRRSDAQPPPGSQWQETSERFVDPESGKTLVVFYDPATGERRYVKSTD